MDISLVIKQFFSNFWYLIPLIILAGIIKSPWFKGIIGEFLINISTKWLLDKNKYHLIKNILLPTEDGTTQVDHIIVSVHGVFVVETKNMKGWIFGSQNQPYWTQKIYKHTNKFQNPLRQNYKHVKTLESLLNISSEQIHSVIVFLGASTFKTEIPKNVTCGGGYARYIRSKTENILTEDQVTTIVDEIESGKLHPAFNTNREHIEHVETIIEKKESTPNCPKCGSPMVLRESKKGKNVGKNFFGCSRFPECKRIKNIT